MIERDTTVRGAIGHGYNYCGHPVGAAAALACLAETQRLQVNKNVALHQAFSTCGIAGEDQGQHLAVFLRRGVDRPGIAITGATVGLQFAGVGFNNFGEERVACGDGDGLVEPNVQLVIAVWVGITQFGSVDFAGFHCRFLRHGTCF